MTQALVRKAFEVRAVTWAQAQSIPLSFENTNFNVPPNGRYASCFVVPGATASPDLTGQIREYVGLFQITLTLPLNQGSKESLDLAESLDAAFPVGVMVQDGFRVWIVSPMSLAQGVPGADSLVVPISARYRAERVLS